MSDFLRYTERAVYKWIRQLETMGILFTNKHKGVVYIFIKPKKRLYKYSKSVQT